jgi:hypothetical protein
MYYLTTKSFVIRESFLNHKVLSKGTKFFFTQFYMFHFFLTAKRSRLTIITQIKNEILIIKNLNVRHFR